MKALWVFVKNSAVRRMEDNLVKLQVKRVVMLAVILAVAALISGCSDTKIGVVDVNKVMTDSPKVQQLEEQLKTSAKTLTDQLEQDKVNLSPEEMQKRTADLSSQHEKTKQDLSTQLNTSMDEAFAAVAKEKNLSVILYKNNVAQGGIDITDDVVKKMQ